MFSENKKREEVTRRNPAKGGLFAQTTLALASLDSFFTRLLPPTIMLNFENISGFPARHGNDSSKGKATTEPLGATAKVAPQAKAPIAVDGWLSSARGCNFVED